MTQKTLPIGDCPEPKSPQQSILTYPAPPCTLQPATSNPKPTPSRSLRERCHPSKEGNNLVSKQISEPNTNTLFSPNLLRSQSLPTHMQPASCTLHPIPHTPHPTPSTQCPTTRNLTQNPPHHTPSYFAIKTST